MSRQWTANELLEFSRGYKSACVLAAAADLDVFSLMADGPLSLDDVVDKLGSDARATAILLDALVALELLDKRDGAYEVSAGVGDALTREGATSVLPMAQHQANCLRCWAQLGVVVMTGRRAERKPSIRGDAADEAAFIGAMHNASQPTVAKLVEAIQPRGFTHLLDVGGASGTWTLALLRAQPGAKATLFDLPSVIPLAKERVAEAGMSDRVTLVAGDYLADPLPGGADLAWVSAIVHQHSRDENRRLFTQVYSALVGGGQIIIRDILMDPSRTSPSWGALFAVNMLVATEAGNSFTFDELREDLETAGFGEAEVLRRDEGLDSLLRAVKPVTS